MKNGIEITEFNAKFWAIFEILDFKGSQLSEENMRLNEYIRYKSNN